MRHENFISARECNNFSLLPPEVIRKSLKQNSFAKALVPLNCYFFEWNITLHNTTPQKSYSCHVLAYIVPSE